MARAAAKKPSTENEEKVEAQGAPPDPSKALSAAIAAFDDEFEKLKLEGKIATISGFLGRIPKNGWNKYNKYTYVLESDLVEHIRYWLAAARILIYPTIKEWRVSDTVASEKRAGDPRTDILYEFHVVDGRTGERFVTEALGQGSDPRDKGSNKASTSAMKFAYLRLFNIASGEDAEKDETGDQRTDAAAAAPVVPLAPPGTAPAAAPTVGASTAEGAQRGGTQAKTSGAQIKAISNLSNTLQLGAEGLVGVIKRVLGDDIELPEDPKEHAKALGAYLQAQDGADAGKLIQALQDMTKAVTKAVVGMDDTAGMPGYGD
jgi:hypothetical protein